MSCTGPPGIVWPLGPYDVDRFAESITAIPTVYTPGARFAGTVNCSGHVSPLLR